MPTHDPTPPALIQFGDWTYQVNLRSLRRGNVERRLKPLLDRLLLRFLREPGAVIRREQLIEEVWTRRLVNDEVLSRAIAELRAALEDDAREPRYIETLAKGGYRWIADLSDQLPSSSVSAPGGKPADVVSDVSLALATAAGSATAQTQRRTLSIIATMVIVLSTGFWWLMRSPQRVNNAQSSPPVDLLTSRPLTADAGLEFDPRFDALGRIVYVRRAGDSRINELVLVDRTGQSERVLWSTDKRLRHPAPSPDGSEIAVLHWPAEHCEIWMISALDGHPSKLTDCADQPGSLLWIDNGAALMFTAAAENASSNAPGLARINRKSGHVSRLTNPSLEEGAHVDPRVSADGQELAYAALHSGERQLWLVDWPSLHERTALLVRPEPIYGHAFEVSGDALWVAGDLISYRALNRLVPGQTPALLGAPGAHAIDIAADGAVVWTQTSFDGEVWIRRPGQTEFRTVAGSTRHESQPSFSPDGKRLALVSNRSGTEGIILVELGASEASDRSIPLRLDQAMRWVRPTWSADGTSLILTAYKGTQTYLYRYAIEGGTLTPLNAEIDSVFAGIELSDRLLFRQGVDATSRLMQVGAGDAAATVVAIGSVRAFRANERWLVWRAAGASVLRVAELNSVQQSREIAALDGSDGEAFTLSADWLYYASAGAVWRRLLPDGEAERMEIDRPVDGQRPSLAVSANGAIAVAGTARASMDLMIAIPTVDASPLN